ncbi:MAG: hypothetical protein Kow001_04760 [Acidobacteriota bacterium]
MRDEIQARILEIFRRELRVPEDTLRSLAPNTPLLGRGVGFDSMEALTLATSVESTFDIRVEDQELTPELFRSFEGFVRFVEGKLQNRGADQR